MFCKRWFYSLLIVWLVAEGNNGALAVDACGYESCPTVEPNMLNVHLVPHSHDDVGWLKTVDQYYYGSENRIQHAGVQYILHSVVQELLKDPKRRFIQVESAFFHKWWIVQDEELQENVRTLVEEGRLEFAGGAWSMNDEATVHYQSVIDQFSVGLKMLSDTFGSCGRPRVGWQIDPFGHSREMASIFAQMGYDGEFFARVDWLEKSARLQNHTAEMIWHGNAEMSERSDLFTGLLYNHYSAPPGFCFDNLCSDEPIIDGDSYDNNVKRRVDAFISYVQKQSEYYRSPRNLLVPMGDDFQYENAAMNFKNMDKLIRYVNDRRTLTKVNIFYSTPSCYLHALHAEKLTWPTKKQDFFPYSTDWHTYWTGYYTSRPTQKRFERDGNHLLQVAKQLSVFANFTTAESVHRLDSLRHVMGIMQHHDAITGTEKQKVAYDYNRLIHEAMETVQGNTRAALQQLTNLTNGEFVSCLQLNISVCEFTAGGVKIGNPLVVTLFNPLAQPQWQYVRVPLPQGDYIVMDEEGAVVPIQWLPVPEAVLALPFRKSKTSTKELVFEAYVNKIASYYIRLDPPGISHTRPDGDKVQIEELDDAARPIPFRFRQNERRPARSVERKSMLITEHTRASNLENSEEYQKPVPAAVPSVDVVVENAQIMLYFKDGHLVSVQMNGVKTNLRQEFFYYPGAYGNNGVFQNRSSGAYIFRPAGPEVLMSKNVTITVHDGLLVKEVHQHWNDWATQVIRLYSGVNRVEFEWLIGPIPIADGVGKEVITRFTSEIENGGVFWTDSNGREMMRRVLNEREGFTANFTEEVSGNYYPITTRIGLQDAKLRMALLTDRAQGGSSLKNGVLELMLHRRLLHDDAFGVGEALNEMDYGRGLVARGKVYMILNSMRQKPTVQERIAQQEIHLPFWKFFSHGKGASSKRKPTVPDFSSVLPLTVQILTLEPFSRDQRLIRFENFMDETESARVTFNIRPIFEQLGGLEIKETTLDGNMPLSEMQRLKFIKDGETTEQSEFADYHRSGHLPLEASKGDDANKFDVSLDPMQIRTFIISWEQDKLK